jgi:aminotransferase
MINFLEPSIDERELESIKKVFDSKWIGKGQIVKELEFEFAKLFNVSADHIVSISCCTEAIFMAMELFSFQHFDEILIPTISFTAVPSAIKKHAKIRLCDVNRDTLQVTVDDLKKNMTYHTKAVFLTHYGGFSCEMKEIVRFCEDRDLLLFEDSACSMFTKHDQKSCGTFGDMGMWSLDSMKIITAGDGGIMYFKDKKIADKARQKTYLGLDKASGLESSKVSDSMWWEYNITSCERRLIMNDISASIGLSQLNKRKEILKKRQSIVETYDHFLCDIDHIKILKDKKSDYVTPYFYTIQTPYRNYLAKYLLENKVYSTFKYYPVHKISFFQEDTCLYGKKIEFPNADYVSNQTLNLPLHANMSEENAIQISKLISQWC